MELPGVPGPKGEKVCYQRFFFFYLYFLVFRKKLNSVASVVEVGYHGVRRSLKNRKNHPKQIHPFCPNPLTLKTAEVKIR